jgi:hypothetical protein
MNAENNKLSLNVVKSLRAFLQSLPSMEDLTFEYKNDLLIKLIIEMIIQENGAISFEQYKNENGYVSRTDYYACVAASMEWIMNNVDLWDYEELPYDFEEHLRQIKFSLKGEKN